MAASRRARPTPAVIIGAPRRHPQRTLSSREYRSLTTGDDETSGAVTKTRRCDLDVAGGPARRPAPRAKEASPGSLPSDDARAYGRGAAELSSSRLRKPCRIGGRLRDRREGLCGAHNWRDPIAPRSRLAAIASPRASISICRLAGVSTALLPLPQGNAAALPAPSRSCAPRPKQQHGPDRASLPLSSSSATALASLDRTEQIRPLSATAALQSTSRSATPRSPGTPACRPLRASQTHGSGARQLSHCQRAALTVCFRNARRPRLSPQCLAAPWAARSSVRLGNAPRTLRPSAHRLVTRCELRGGGGDVCLHARARTHSDLARVAPLSDSSSRCEQLPAETVAHLHQDDRVRGGPALPLPCLLSPRSRLAWMSSGCAGSSDRRCDRPERLVPLPACKRNLAASPSAVGCADERRCSYPGYRRREGAA